MPAEATATIRFSVLPSVQHLFHVDFVMGYKTSSEDPQPTPLLYVYVWICPFSFSPLCAFPICSLTYFVCINILSALAPHNHLPNSVFTK